MVTTDLFENNEKIDAFVFTDESNRFYFTRLETSFGAVVIGKERNVFITDFRYESEAREKVSDFEIVITGYAGFYDKIAEVLASMNAKHVGYGEKMYIDEFNAFKRALSAFKLRPAEDVVSAKRAVKTDEEISFMATAQQIAEGALKRAVSKIKAGITERELMAEINYGMKLGATASPPVGQKARQERIDTRRYGREIQRVLLGHDANFLYRQSRSSARRRLRHSSGSAGVRYQEYQSGYDLSRRRFACPRVYSG